MYSTRMQRSRSVPCHDTPSTFCCWLVLPAILMIFHGVSTFIEAQPRVMGRMKLYSVAKTGSVADIMVSCECKKKRSASDAFSEQRSEALGQCTRHRPWLGIGNRDTKSCVNAKEIRPHTAWCDERLVPSCSECFGHQGIGNTYCKSSQYLQSKTNRENKLRR